MSVLLFIMKVCEYEAVVPNRNFTSRDTMTAEQTVKAAFQQIEDDFDDLDARWKQITDNMVKRLIGNDPVALEEYKKNYELIFGANRQSTVKTELKLLKNNLSQ